jgi:SAM-dependent methyltransferase
MPRIEPFEKFSDAYDRWFDEHAEMYTAELQAVRQAIPTSASASLEVGVGSGKFAGPLGIPVGLEPSGKMAAKAQRQGISVCRGVAEELPFSSEAFDLLLMVTTICFVDDAGSSLREAFRVLKPGGWVVIGFVDRNSDLGRRYVAKRGSSRFYGMATFFSSKEVLDLLGRAGFRVDEIRQTLVPGMAARTVLRGFGRGAFVVVRGASRAGR